MGLGGYLHLTPNIRITGGVRNINLEGDIEHSPILESGINMAVNVGVAYVFSLLWFFFLNADIKKGLLMMINPFLETF
ncbi:MipA/OmpV family protein [Vibrio cyclitrophicus]|nr:MipA/OmpV family protein [Vibrio sp. OPT10]MBU2930356.1 MipA/OmpV family protein [Vibrio cyclitrophicus]MBY7662104.1 MipA/OmpV family protein [Vibrio atlanticus]MCC4773078.1 MipA/OmpV family protein [Vibrio cyclitrophicus]MCC4842148.1 MipA/OmpV family protein [Vibrio cyclitrophicus]